MKKYFSKPFLVLLCAAASITACKHDSGILHPANYINTSTSEAKVDPVSWFYSFSDYDLIYFLITKNGASVYVSEQ